MSDRAIHYLIHRVAERIGFRAEAISFATAVQALRSRFPRGLSTEELARRVQSGDEELERALLEAVSVGETFFFRQPEHFRFLAENVAPRFRSGVVRAWSAGCATGEETYSLAACLLANVAAGVKVEVLGTDVTERNILAAQRGVYGPWSIREGGPILFPTFQRGEPGRFVVSDEVRAVTTFGTHNLLEPAPSAHPFDVIFCRNVLLYFSAEAAIDASARMVEALAPGGLIVFGTLDVSRPPQGTEAVGPREANMFAKSTARRTRVPKRSLRAPSHSPSPLQSPKAARSQPPPRRSKPPPPIVIPGPAKLPAPPRVAVRVTEEDHVGDHLRALASIEQSDYARAETLLKALRGRAPHYLPGLFELGVLLAKRGQRRQAETIMREVMQRTANKPPNEPVPGPEELTIAYYRVAAEAYLGFKV